ncbi:MAG: cyclopropane-fatty-acyl-phospholipid synthase family protein [Pseudomonadota bacterium]
MDGGFEMVEGEIHDLMALFFANKRNFDLSPSQIFWRSLHRRLRRLHQHNPISRALANVKTHYDIGDDIYRLFLDRDLQYSCAYFETGSETLEEAQLAKKRHIAAKLRIADGQRVLDIGCGWGGMALYLAHLAEVEVVGITLSENQRATAERRAEMLGVADRVRFELCDYREAEGRYDRIVSVGMLEHVGIQNMTPYFLKVRDLLAPGGVALVHSISTKAPPGVTGPFLRKHIFPGGYAPSLSEAVAAVEFSGLWTLDCEVWRVHYGHTLRAWRERFAAERATARSLMGERFCRMWELYLSICECAFFYGASNVVQLQLGRERDAVPVTRDYIAPDKDALRAREAGFVDRVAASAHGAIVDLGRTAPSQASEPRNRAGAA